jgi:hypothetical protein
MGAVESKSAPAATPVRREGEGGGPDKVVAPHSDYDRDEASHDPREEMQEAQKRGWLAVGNVMYENAVRAIIRPPRDLYGSRELGPVRFSFRDRRFVRKDFILRNPRGMALQCSHWMPVDEDRPSKRLPCVVCLHGNSSSRVSAKYNLDVVLNEVRRPIMVHYAMKQVCLGAGCYAACD